MKIQYFYLKIALFITVVFQIYLSSATLNSYKLLHRALDCNRPKVFQCENSVPVTFKLNGQKNFRVKLSYHRWNLGLLLS